VRDALRNLGLPIAAADILVLGASYREDVGDTRYSGVELIVRRLAAMGATLRVHDPYLQVWPELEETDESHGNARFFSRQEGLRGLRIQKDLDAALKGIKALVLAVRHRQYLDLDPEALFRAVGGRFAVVDCFCILDDRRIERFFELGCEVKGMGRGHIQRIKEKVRTSRK
jgi:UDP-N-acetyl-D-mannosaminuronate dehydrogenase